MWHFEKQLDQSMTKHMVELDAVLQRHAEAVTRASEASEKYANSLARATWVLAVATVLLALSTVGLLVAPFVRIIPGN